MIFHQDVINEDSDGEELIKTVSSSPPNDTVQPHWPIARLGDACDIIMGQSPPSETYNREGQGIPFLQGKAEFTDIHPIPIIYCTKPHKIASQGSVLMSVRAPVGDCNIADRKYAIGRGLASISLKHGDNWFLFYTLCHKKMELKAQGTGSTFEAINSTVLANFSLSFPPIAEQQAIAQVLQAVQETIQARRREIELEREQKTALMVYLFTHGTYNEPTKQSNVGEIPESWEVVKLRNLCANDQGILQTGPFGSQLHATDYQERGIPVINPTHLGMNTIAEEHLPLISEEDAARLSRHSLAEGDILLSRRGDFNRYAYIDRDHATWLCGTGSLLIRLRNPSINNYFLSVYIGSTVVQNYLADNAIGSTMPNLNTRILENLPVILPSISEQCEIAEGLRACGDKIIALEHELTLLEEFFQALLEELMTGRLSTLPLIEKEHIA